MALSVTLCVTAALPLAFGFEQRDMVGHLRKSYNNAFFYRHNGSFRISSVLHIAHPVQHDILQLSQLEHHAEVDMESDAEFLMVTFEKITKVFYLIALFKGSASPPDFLAGVCPSARELLSGGCFVPLENKKYHLSAVLQNKEAPQQLATL